MRIAVLLGQTAKDWILVFQCHGMERKVIAPGRCPGELILPPREVGNDLAIWVDHEQQRVEIGANVLEQLGSIVSFCNLNQSVIDYRVVGAHRALGELAVFINVDSFGQPLIDSFRIGRAGDGVIG